MTDARTMLWSARAVLLDFDGPVTPLMPAPINRQTADAARAALAGHGIEPVELRETSDHLAIIRWTGAYAGEALPDVEVACTNAEVEAARTSQPTAGAHELIAALHEANVPVVVVTNNAASAVRTYLDRFHLSARVRGVIGRPEHRPDLMKPSTHTVDAAIAITGVNPANTVFIGDSVSDVTVAHAAGVQSIGYAKNPRRGHQLAAAKAGSLTTTISALLPGDSSSMDDQKIMEAVLREGLDDWVSLDSVLWFTTGGAMSTSARARSLRILHRLYAEGLMAPGSLGETGFETWEGSVRTWVERAARELDVVNWRPAGAGFWLSLTALGEIVARNLEASKSDQ